MGFKKRQLIDLRCDVPDPDMDDDDDAMQELQARGGGYGPDSKSGSSTQIKRILLNCTSKRINPGVFVRHSSSRFTIHTYFVSHQYCKQKSINSSPDSIYIYIQFHVITQPSILEPRTRKRKKEKI